MKRVSEHTHGFTGTISLEELADVVQLFALCRRSGAVDVSSRGSVGTIWFAKGEIIHAKSGPLSGAEALFEILSWDAGQFSTSGDNGHYVEQTISGSWQGYLMESCRRRDEESRRSPSVEDRSKRENRELNAILQELSDLSGFLGACVVDSNTGSILGTRNNGTKDIESLAANNAEIVRIKSGMMDALGLTETIEDILITIGDQFHLIRSLGSGHSLFIFLVLDRHKSNLAMGRHVLGAAETFRTNEVRRSKSCSRLGVKW